MEMSASCYGATRGVLLINGAGQLLLVDVSRVALSGRVVDTSAALEVPMMMLLLLWRPNNRILIHNGR